MSYLALSLSSVKKTDVVCLFISPSVLSVWMSAVAVCHCLSTCPHSKIRQVKGKTVPVLHAVEVGVQLNVSDKNDTLNQTLFKKCFKTGFKNFEGFLRSSTWKFCLEIYVNRIAKLKVHMNRTFKIWIKIKMHVNKHCEGNHLFSQVYFYIIIIF